ncbi:MAG: glycoside hydrolase family 73 protein [Janthinobacterium lividum]
MRHSQAVHLMASVGQGGVNQPHDIRGVQQLLNEHLPTPMRRLAVDGRCGPLTVAVIAECQRRYVRMTPPDGRIDPHGPTLRVLNAAERALPASTGTPPPVGLPPRAPARQAAPPAVRPAALRRPAPAAGAHVRVPPADVIAAAQRSQQTWHIPASVTLGQWALESGWGHHMPTGSNNPFGIKARKGERRVAAWTHEVITGQTVRVLADFRVFDNIGQAFDHHGRLLATYRPYAAARAHLNDPDAFAEALTGVYATGRKYGEKLRGQMQAGDFYRYYR